MAGELVPGHFNLFWMNVRLNVRDRTNAYLANNGAAYPLITSPIVATASLGAPFAFTVTTQNQATSITATGLPPGLTISASGAIAGVPATAGTSAIVITASNSAGSSTGELALTVR